MISKSEIRRINKDKRKAMTKEEVAEKSALAQHAFLESELYKNASQIMLYMPLGNEIGTDEMLKAAFNDDKKVVLPVTNGETGEITPYLITKDTQFAVGAFKVKEPVNAQIADVTKTDVIIVPGIAYDRKGARVGFGKGCYDMLLCKSDAIKIGYCYEYQICEGIEDEAHDMRMDHLLTEKGITSIK
ncbi:MAG: 5-formyltetrahydrofolate cyclo-ligase [Clostridia bacterium]|nr:5-formyltetrahydrofolate cyclo-ligase [Clostridia bacterium]